MTRQYTDLADSDARVIGLGGTYHTHQQEGGRSYRWPDLWVYPDSAVIGDGDPIRIPRGTDNIKPGCELTAVIAGPLTTQTKEAAWDAVAGFTVSNDVTAAGEWPGWSDPDHGMITGVGYKLFPGFCPILEAFTPREDLDSYANRSVHVDVDGETSVSGSTADLAFSIPELILFADRIVPLRAGDLIALGDPGSPRVLLDSADEVVCTVEGVGTLRNPVANAG